MSIQTKTDTTRTRPDKGGRLRHTCGALSSKAPRYNMIPRAALVRLATRCGDGEGLDGIDERVRPRVAGVRTCYCIRIHIPYR